MSMSIESFNALLISQRVPYYSILRFQPENIFNYFKFGGFTCKRKIKFVSHDSRDEVVRISKDDQHNTYINLCNMQKINPFVVGISSTPNDYLALETASCIIYSLLRRKHIEFKFINTNFNPRLDEDETRYDVVVLYGVIPERERLYQIKDILYHYPKSLRLVTIGGMNPIKYFDDYIRQPISGALNIVAAHIPIGSGKVKKHYKTRYPIFTAEASTLLKPIADEIRVKHEERLARISNIEGSRPPKVKRSK